MLVFDGFYKVSGVPSAAMNRTSPASAEQTKVAPFAMDVDQKFTAPPPRYSEASLIKMLESEGIGRPSPYASIIGVIQDSASTSSRRICRFFATDLGEVIGHRQAGIEAFPEIMDVGYTRDMEKELDKVEEDHIDWVQMLHRFYNPFKKALKDGEKNLVHAKAETVPAPEQYRCPECGSSLVYRFGKNEGFLSCFLHLTPTAPTPVPWTAKASRDPRAETVDIACPKCGNAMTKRVGRFGPFLGCSKYNDKKDPCDGILNLDKKSKVKAPSMPALLTELPCDKCQAPLNLRNGVRGPWLSCSRFPKCRGRGKWNDIAPEPKAKLEEALHAHEKANPIPIIKTMAGKALTDATGKPLADALPVGQNPDTPETLESIADEVA